MDVTKGTIFESIPGDDPDIFVETLVNEEGTGLESQLFIASCLTSKDTIFWVIAKPNQRPYVSGESENYRAAEADVLKELNNKRATNINPNFALQEYVEKQIEDAIEEFGQENFSTTARVEYVYEKYGLGRFQIKEVTSTDVMVYAPRWHQGLMVDNKTPTFRLSKRELDNKGETKARGQVYCTQAKKEAFDKYRKVPEYLKIFGLDWDATSSQVKYWFRKLSKEYHPDMGGSEEKFTELKKSYEKAITAITDKDRRDGLIQY